MKIKYFGMSALMITTENGTRIFTDPFDPEGYAVRYNPIKETADIVTVSHEHGSHNHVESISGNPKVYRGPEPKVIKGIKFSGVPTYHDNNHGNDFGNNTVIYFKVDGIRICHLGDLGHKLSTMQLKQIGRVDVLFIPVGGLPVMTIELCNFVSDQLKPKVIIPIHCWDKPYSPPPPPGPPPGLHKGPPPGAKMGDGILHVNEFLKGKKNVKRMGSSEVEFKVNTLPSERQIIVLKEASDIDN